MLLQGCVAEEGGRTDAKYTARPSQQPQGPCRPLWPRILRFLPLAVACTGLLTVPWVFSACSRLWAFALDTPAPRPSGGFLPSLPAASCPGGLGGPVRCPSQHGAPCQGLLCLVFQMLTFRHATRLAAACPCWLLSLSLKPSLPPGERGPAFCADRACPWGSARRGAGAR